MLFCEIDKYCQEVLKKFWNKKIYNDVKEITKQKLKSDGIEFPEIITGGFPCQPFSIAGSRKGSNDSRHLWPEMFRIIKEFKPRWVIGENVRNIINIQDGMVFENVCTDLEGEGYEVRAFNIPAACWCPTQKRKNLDFWRTPDERSGGSNLPGIKKALRSRAHEKTKRSFNTSKIRGPSEGTKTVANTSTGRCPPQEEQISTRGDSSKHQSRWEVEPNVGRVADGLPGRIHRLRALGNSIVPQIAEEIGKAIMMAERRYMDPNKFELYLYLGFFVTVFTLLYAYLFI